VITQEITVEIESVISTVVEEEVTGDGTINQITRFIRKVKIILNVGLVKTMDIIQTNVEIVTIISKEEEAHIGGNTTERK